MDKYVKIKQISTGEVVETMGPMDEHRAERVTSGASINMNHEEYEVVIEDEE